MCEKQDIYKIESCDNIKKITKKISGKIDTMHQKFSNMIILLKNEINERDMIIDLLCRYIVSVSLSCPPGFYNEDSCGFKECTNNRDKIIQCWKNWADRKAKELADGV